MATNSNIINWENVLTHSNTFQDQKPTKWTFLEEFFVRDFYEKLYETYPKKDEGWFFESTDDKSAYGTSFIITYFLTNSHQILENFLVFLLTE